MGVACAPSVDLRSKAGFEPTECSDLRREVIVKNRLVLSIRKRPRGHSLSRSVCAERAPRAHLTDSLLLLGEDVLVILNVGPFNHARSVLTHRRFCLLSLRTRVLVLLANRITEALLQLVLSCLETVCARVLCIAWSAKQQDCEQRTRE